MWYCDTPHVLRRFLSISTYSTLNCFQTIVNLFMHLNCPFFIHFAFVVYPGVYWIWFARNCIPHIFRIAPCCEVIKCILPLFKYVCERAYVQSIVIALKLNILLFVRFFFFFFHSFWVAESHDKQKMKFAP